MGFEWDFHIYNILQHCFWWVRQIPNVEQLVGAGGILPRLLKNTHPIQGLFREAMKHNETMRCKEKVRTQAAIGNSWDWISETREQFLLQQSIIDYKCYDIIIRISYIIPSGKQTVCYWKWPIEIVDLPMKHVILHQSVVFFAPELNIWPIPNLAQHIENPLAPWWSSTLTGQTWRLPELLEINGGVWKHHP